jgi:serine/threonine protein kinase
LQKSALLGTPPYIAPELINENIEEYSSKIDIWALGVLYFYMIF